MAGDATRVRVGVNGSVYTAPAGTDTPDDVNEALHNDFEDLGYVSEDGVTQTISSDSNVIKAWGGDTVRTIQTSHDYTLALTLIETSAATARVYYGDDEATDAEIKVKGDQGYRGAWVFDVFDGDVGMRIVVPDGQVSERGDVSYRTEEAIGYPITITCYPDGDGVKAYIYRDDDLS